jgi:hypothetical protein
VGVGVVSGGHSLASARFSRGTSGRVGAAGEPLRAVQDHRRATLKLNHIKHRTETNY